METKYDSDFRVPTVRPRKHLNGNTGALSFLWRWHRHNSRRGSTGQRRVASELTRAATFTRKRYWLATQPQAA